MYKKLNKRQQGFTLVEILVVIAIIGILALIVVVALNPVARFQDSRNTTRKNNVDNILQAFRLYAVDNNGNYPTGIPTLDTGDFSGTPSVPKCQPALSTATAVCVGLTSTSAPGSSLIASGKSYLQTVPADNPSNSQTGDANTSTYYVGVTNDKQHVVVFSANMEPGTTGQGPIFYEEN